MSSESMRGTSLMVQWPRLCASIARGMSLIPGQGTKILHAKRGSKKNKTKKKKQHKGNGRVIWDSKQKLVWGDHLYKGVEEQVSISRWFWG